MTHPPIIVSIVVARYKEDLAWLCELSQLAPQYVLRFYVYDKGPDDTPDTFDKKSALCARLSEFAESLAWQRLPNVGRETHTYVHHMLAHYDQYQAEKDQQHYLLFVQGDIRDHMKGPSHAVFLRALIEDARRHGTSRSLHIVEYNQHDFRPGLPIPNDARRQRKGEGVIELSDPYPFGPWYQSVFGAPLPARVPWWHAAVFCIKVDRVAMHPKALYETLLSDHLATLNPEAGHYMERSWYLMYNR